MSSIRRSNRSQPRKHEANCDTEDEDPIVDASNEPLQATEISMANGSTMGQCTVNFGTKCTKYHKMSISYIISHK